MNRAFARFRNWFNSIEYDRWDLSVVLGVAVFSYGARQVYEPAGYLVAGAALVIIGIFGNRS